MPEGMDYDNGRMEANGNNQGTVRNGIFKELGVTEILDPVKTAHLFSPEESSALWPQF